MNNSCVDMMKNVIEHFSLKFDDGFEVNNKKYVKLLNICSYLDSVYDDFWGEYLCIGVITNTKQIIIDLSCASLPIESLSDKICLVINSSQKVNFETEKENLLISFTFEGIWDKV